MVGEDFIIDLIRINYFSLFLDEWTILILLALIVISACLYYHYMGYEGESILYAFMGSLLSAIGILFCIWGFLIFNIIPLDAVNNLTIISDSTTNINISISNSSTECNFSYISSYNVTNISEKSMHDLPSETTSEIDTAIKFLSSGIFGNSVGTIGIGLAIFSFGASFITNIDTNRDNEEINARLQNKEYILKKYKSALLHKHILLIGGIWVGIGVIYFIISFIAFIIGIRIFNPLPLHFPIFGLIIILFGIYRSYQKPIIPIEYTFQELVQKVNDEKIV